MTPPKTYDDWLALTPEKQHHVHFSVWDVCGRDGLAIAHMAATRLAMSTPRKVLQIAVGTYHGGEYLLHLTVSDEDYATCPAMLEQTFEGFRVVWLPLSKDLLRPDEAAQIAGAWVAENDTSDAIFHMEATPNGIVISGHISFTGESLAIFNVTGNGSFLLFDAFGSRSGYRAQHTFRLIGPDRCENQTTTTTYWRRASNDAPNLA